MRYAPGNAPGGGGGRSATGTGRGKWWPLVAITLGNFMLLVDVTIVNTALPRIADGLGASFTSLQWVMDGYALALAALLMVAGSAADLYGRRRLYVAGLAVFALASLACGLAPARSCWSPPGSSRASAPRRCSPPTPRC
ncbi:MFS transporter [Streptomyces noursei]|nr:MFS transporter [Streptomyces noursei]